MPRPQHNTFDLSHSRKFSMAIGKITPICVTECIPGDSFNIKTTSLLRFAPLLAPIMHQSSVYCHFFFVPNRILWPSWEEFITGGEDAADPGYTPPVFPNLSPSGSSATILPGTLFDYLGMPTGDTNAGTSYTGRSFSPLPLYAYNKIYNEYYRDQNLCDKVTDTATDGGNSWSASLNTLQNRAWQHDYFTSALPWTQKGPEATIPLGTTAPLINETGTANNFTLASTFQNTDGTALAGKDIYSGQGVGVGGWIADTDNLALPRQLDITDHTKVDLTDATASSINDLRAKNMDILWA